MPSKLKWATHNDFSKGIAQDQPTYLLPEGFVYDAQNMFITKTGQLRKRYGNTKHTTDTGGLVPTSIAAVRNYFSTVTDIGYLAYRDAVTGTTKVTSFACQDAQTALSPAGTWIDTYFKGYPGVPTTWSGHALTPLSSPGAIAVGSTTPFYALGGSVPKYSGSAPTSGGAATVTALSDTISVSTPNVNAVAGDYLYCAISGTSEYIGRIKEVVTTSSFRVEPTPTLSFAATSSLFYSAVGMLGSKTETGTTEMPAGAGAIAVHQNRIVIGNVTTNTLTAAGKANRIYWSTLLNAPADSPVSNVDGFVPFLKSGWLRRNYETFTNMNAVVSIVPIGPSTLLILGDTGVSLVSGTLGTITTDTTTTNYAVRVLSSSIGCISAASVQLTPQGVIFASQDGLYITDGNNFTNIFDGKIKNFWRQSIASTATVRGSAILEDRIYSVSTTSTGDDSSYTYFCDLANNYAITRTAPTNAGSLPYLMSAQDPAPQSNRVYAIGLYTDTTICKDPQLLRLDTIYPKDLSSFILDVSLLDGFDVLGGGSGTYDANNNSVYGKIITKSYTEGDPNTMRRFRHTTVLTSLQGSDVSGSNIYVDYVMGTNNTTSWINANRYNLGTTSRPSSLSETAQAFRKRFDTNMNAQAIMYVVSERGLPKGAATNPWTLHEITTATNQLAPGRGGTGLVPDSSTPLVS